jgi:hypothetical protein
MAEIVIEKDVSFGLDINILVLGNIENHLGLAVRVAVPSVYQLPLNPEKNDPPVRRRVERVISTWSNLEVLPTNTERARISGTRTSQCFFHAAS